MYYDQSGDRVCKRSRRLHRYDFISRMAMASDVMDNCLCGPLVRNPGVIIIRLEALFGSPW